MEHQNIILEKSIDFSLAIITFCEKLEEGRKYVIAQEFINHLHIFILFTFSHSIAWNITT